MYVCVYVFLHVKSHSCVCDVIFEPVKCAETFWVMKLKKGITLSAAKQPNKLTSKSNTQHVIGAGVNFFSTLSLKIVVAIIYSRSNAAHIHC